ncbi:MAG: hypothetical protein EBT51_11795 [Flavobacteriaceae bacterium]|nr:hypothetical protein [Flavobacteriaceae bacterium]
MAFLLMVSSLTAQVGINTANPKAALDIESSNYGVVMPRLALTSTQNESPASNPQGGNIPAGTVLTSSLTTWTNVNFMTWLGSACYIYGSANTALSYGNLNTIEQSKSSFNKTKPYILFLNDNNELVMEYDVESSTIYLPYEDITEYLGKHFDSKTFQLWFDKKYNIIPKKISNFFLNQE